LILRVRQSRCCWSTEITTGGRLAVYTLVPQLQKDMCQIKCCIGGGVLGGSFLDISDDDFERQNANLLVLLGIEEKYEMLIANYLVVR
jgi:hypothetical protein